MNKIVCYTCITNQYDRLKEPISVQQGIDYICFSDQPVFSTTWKWMPIPDDLKYLSKVKQQRIIKICPHRYLPNYDISIWIDGSILICGNLLDFISQYDLDANPIYSRIHPTRKCIYDEADACIGLKKDRIDTIQNQISKYKNENYPKNIGMVETGILLRKHNDKKCMMIDNAWAVELLNNSCRDQLSFNYICWKNKFVPGYLTKQLYINNQFFRIERHG